MYSFESTVRYSECDAEGNLSVPALINYLQDCSTFHTESIGHGVRWCAAHGFAWFILAWQIRVHRMPRFCERIVVTTWSWAERPTMARRNFTIANDVGDVLVEADSLWTPFDVAKGRPGRIPASEYTYLTDDTPLDLPPTQRKLHVEGAGSALEPIPITEQYLDSNHHVNNGHYVAMAEHAVRGHDGLFRLRHLHVQYQQAAKLGDVIVPHLHEEITGYAVRLTDEDGRIFAIVRMCR